MATTVGGAGQCSAPPTVVRSVSAVGSAGFLVLAPAPVRHSAGLPGTSARIRDSGNSERNDGAEESQDLRLPTTEASLAGARLDRDRMSCLEDGAGSERTQEAEGERHRKDDEKLRFH